MSAVFKREFRAYFTTPIGFIVIAAFYFFLGLYFSMIYSYGSPDTAMVIVAMSTVIVFTMPVLTMRLMSEDRRQKVDQALLTAPVSLTSIVMGKFFAALAVFAIGFAPTVIFEIIVASYVSVNIMSYIYALFGMLLLGSALISIGMFISVSYTHLYGDGSEKKEKRVGSAKRYIIEVPNRQSSVEPDDEIWTVSGNADELLLIKPNGTQVIYCVGQKIK